MLNRRSLQIGLVGSLLLPRSGHAQSERVHAGTRIFGCCLPHDLAANYLSLAADETAGSNSADQLIKNSASPMLDFALAQTLAMLCDKFQIKPGFSYYEEPKDDPVNAHATDQALFDRADGTVLFGLGMLGELLGRPQDGATSIVAVAAHEFGHIVAFKRGLNKRLAPDEADPFRAEQFADYMAGVFGAFRHREDATFPAVQIALTMRSFGGTQRGTHGTSEERGRAVQQGYVAAMKPDAGLDDLVDSGFSYAMSRV